MAEEQAVDEKETKVPLRGARAAKATMERLQRKGILPTREAPSVAASPPEEDERAGKAFNIKTEDIPRAVRSIPFSRETIPPDIKRELTEKARELNTIAMGTGSEGSPETPTLPATPAPKKEFSVLEEEQHQAEQNAPWTERVLAENRAQRQAEAPQPPAEPLEPVKIASQEVPLAAPAWTVKEKERMVTGAQRAAVRQVGATPPARAPLPTTEQVAAKQSIEQGQKIKKSWLDRIPFLKVLRGEKSPA